MDIGAVAVLVMLTNALLRINTLTDVLMLTSTATSSVAVGVLVMGTISTAFTYLVVGTSILMGVTWYYVATSRETRDMTVGS